MSIKGTTPQERRPRKPTRDEKQLIKNNKLDWNNWLVTGTDNIAIAIINKSTGKRRVIFR